MSDELPVETLPVDFGMERKYVFNALTSDISTADCILDLIDNSIDAARRDIATKKGGKLKNGLPKSYKGYKITLTLKEDCISVSDNCRGMETHLLKDTAFRLGARHEQDFSIGIYGVGLIRAFWKLGNTGTLTTDNSENAFTLGFTKDDLTDNESSLEAEKTASSGNKSNLLEIEDLTPDTLYDLDDEEWYSRLLDRIHRVYGLCISKGLVIEVNSSQIAPFGPGIRQDITELMGSDELTTSNGVKVECKIGVHQDYLFKGEDGWTQRVNKAVIPECGWYVVCNDRIVLVADRSEKVGWTSTWHSEYNGILGWVVFTSDDADLLPWDSTKTDISLEKRSQRETAKILKGLSDNYRSINRNFKYGNDDNGGSGSGNGGQGNSDKNRSGNGSGDGGGDHNENWKTLLPKMELKTNDKKLKALIHEAQIIKIEYTYACSMLYRTILERAITVRIRTEGQYNTVREMIFEEQEKAGRSFTEAQKKSFKPTLANMLDWLKANTDFFDDAHRRDCVKGLDSFKAHIKKLNGVFHEGDLIGSDKLKTIREETYYLLSYLVETP